MSIQAHHYTTTSLLVVFLAAWAHKNFFASPSKGTDKQSPGKSSLVDNYTEEITQVYDYNRTNVRRTFPPQLPPYSVEADQNP